MMSSRAIAERTTAKGIGQFDATTGLPTPPVDEAQATAIANAAWKPTTKPDSKSSRLTAERPECRAALPAWRIADADPDATSIFADADPGKITAVRTGDANMRLVWICSRNDAIGNIAVMVAVIGAVLVPAARGPI